MKKLSITYQNDPAVENYNNFTLSNGDGTEYFISDESQRFSVRRKGPNGKADCIVEIISDAAQEITECHADMEEVELDMFTKALPEYSPVWEAIRSGKIPKWPHHKVFTPKFDMRLLS